MVNPESRPELAKRRSVLQMTALVGGLGTVPSAAGANGRQNSGDGESNDDGVILGEFRNGLDGWTTTGATKLERVNEGDVPAGVSRGEHALAVEIDGDMYPMIENRRRVKDADFLAHPHLSIHVLAQADETDSDLLARVRLHHSAADKNRSDGSNSKRSRSSRSKNENVVESEWKSVSQLRPQRLHWDMSDHAEEILKQAKRLEVVWYLEDHEPEGGHRGQNRGEFDYQGFTIFDDIRLFESAPMSDTQHSQNKKRDLHRDHGMIVDRRFEERREGFERGTLVFVDGAEIPYSFEVLNDGRFNYTIDGEAFELGGEDDE